MAKKGISRHHAVHHVYHHLTPALNIVVYAVLILVVVGALKVMLISRSFEKAGKATEALMSPESTVVFTVNGYDLSTFCIGEKCTTPIAAQVVVRDGSTILATESSLDGRVEISHLPPKLLRAEISAVGYASLAIIFNPDEENNVRVTLMKTLSKNKEQQDCANLQSISRRDTCYMNSAIEGDYSVCAKVENHYLKKSCESLAALNS